MKKKGLSAVVGYVLLMAFVMVMGGVIYYWMSSYIPKDEIKCPDGVSVYIENFDCDESAKTINLTLKNNGRFNVEGYFVRGTEQEKQEVATTDLSSFGDGEKGIIRFEGDGLLEPEDKETKIFDFTDAENIPAIYLIEIIPVREEVIENKKRLATCSDAKISEKINCVFEGE